MNTNRHYLADPNDTASRRRWIAAMAAVVAVALYGTLSLISGVWDAAGHATGPAPAIDSLLASADSDGDVGSRAAAAADVAAGVHLHLNNHIWGNTALDRDALGDATAAAATNIRDCPDVADKFSRLANAVYAGAADAAHELASRLDNAGIVSGRCDGTIVS